MNKVHIYIFENISASVVPVSSVCPLICQKHLFWSPVSSRDVSGSRCLGSVFLLFSLDPVYKQCVCVFK